MGNWDVIYKALTAFLDTPIGKAIGGWIYLVIPIFVSIRPVMNFWGDIKQSRIKKLRMVLSEGDSYLGDNTKEFLKENLEEEYFKLATGVHISQGFQRAMMELYRKDNCGVSFYHFKRAIPYMDYDSANNCFRSVKIHWLETLFGLSISFSGIFIFVKAVAFFTMLPKLQTENGWFLLIFFVLIFILGFIGVFMIFHPYSIYKSCKHIQSKISHNQIVCWYQKVPKQHNGKDCCYWFKRRGIRIFVYIAAIALVWWSATNASTSKQPEQKLSEAQTIQQKHN